MDKNLKEIRKRNLEEVISWPEIGKASVLSRLINTSPSYLSQILSDNPIRSVGDDLAAKVEEHLNLPKGWMSEDHAAPAVVAKLSPQSLIQAPSSQPDAKQTSDRWDAIPVLGTAQKGPIADWADENARRRDADQVLRVTMNDALAYALIVSRDIDRIGARSGSALLIEPSITPMVGDDVFIKLNSGDTVICRIAGQVAGRILISNQGDFPTDEIAKPDIALMHWVAGVMAPRVIEAKLENLKPSAELKKTVYAS